jgi:hypothetical protein
MHLTQKIAAGHRGSAITAYVRCRRTAAGCIEELGVQAIGTLCDHGAESNAYVLHCAWLHSTNARHNYPKDVVMECRLELGVQPRHLENIRAGPSELLERNENSTDG